MNDPILQSDFVCVLPSGERRALTVLIGRPYQASSGEWWCPLALKGLTGERKGAAGEDALQSLCLALRFVISEMDRFIQTGGQILDREGRDPLPLGAYWDHGLGKGRPA